MSALRVLIVEDEFIVAEFIANMVEMHGHTVTGIAATAEDALEQFARAPADFAILDIRLAGPRDGIELARELRRRNPRLAFVFISGSGDPGTRARASETNPMAFLQKPFSANDLLIAFDRVNLAEGEPVPAKGGPTLH